MNRFVVISDLHLDWVTAGVDRHHEVYGAMEMARHKAKAIGATMLILGDISDPDSRGRTLRAQRLASQYARALDDQGTDHIWIAGNHDVVDDGTGETTLACLAGTGAQVFEGPGIVGSLSGTSLFRILCLPYPSLARAYDPDAFVTDLDAPFDMVIAHLMVPGAQPGEETTEMPRGRDVRFPVEATAKVPYRLNGHYHQQQEIPQEHGSPIIIPGSLAALTFPGNTPGFLILECP